MVHWFLAECHGRENCRGFVKLQYIFERVIEIRENFRVLSKICENRESFVPWRIFCLRYYRKKAQSHEYKKILGLKIFRPWIQCFTSLCMHKHLHVHVCVGNDLRVAGIYSPTVKLLNW